MPVFWLNEDELAFPHPSLADPGGLLAVGGDLSEDRLILAYQNGIFPWFEEDGAYYWYAPDPRWVLFPQELKVHKSMRPIFNQHKFRYSLDTCFERVMRACSSTPRGDHEGSWISDSFIEGYARLHHQGLAHSVEVWDGENLVGGLYGISLGKIFFGESMFAHALDASKAGFIVLVRALQQLNFVLVDCQQQTPHLESLGARGISKEHFSEYLFQNQYAHTHIGKWKFNSARHIEISPEK